MNDERHDEMRLDRSFEIFEVVILAIAAVLTAWAAFQSTKWGGVQADNYARAGAARTEASRASTRAGQLTSIDVTTFTSWIAAIGAERRDGETGGLSADGTYVPAATESGFLYARFRPELKTATDAWLAERPLTNPDAPPTPLAMPQYQLADNDRAVQLERQSEKFAEIAQGANQTGDNYVLMTILFALVLLFVGVGSKMDTLRARLVMFVLAAATLLVSAIVVFTFPIQF